jgi:hypothetical protein
MSWHISNIKNEVVINVKIARDLFKSDADICCTWNDNGKLTDEDLLDYLVGYKGDDGKYRLYFSDDHMEHMDFVDDESIQNVLKKHKVKGDICFASLDGDNAGTAWGYRFDGKGGMVHLKGELVFTECK